jgi:hypothetical protein
MAVHCGGGMLDSTGWAPRAYHRRIAVRIGTRILILESE